LFPRKRKKKEKEKEKGTKLKPRRITKFGIQSYQRTME
jgi:hypothetical protein